MPYRCIDSDTNRSRIIVMILKKRIVILFSRNTRTRFRNHFEPTCRIDNCGGKALVQPASHSRSLATRVSVPK